MREQDLILGGKSPEYDARGIWTGPHPAYSGWAPKEPGSLFAGHIIAISAAGLAALALTLIERMF